MAKYTLTIETNDPIELADITAAIAEEQIPHPEEHLALDAPKTTAPATLKELAQEPEAPKARRGRPATKPTAASAVETIGGTEGPADKTPGESTPSTTASPSEAEAQVKASNAIAQPAAGEVVTAQDCKMALNAAMDRDVPPVMIQQKMIEKFGAGSVMKIAEDRYPELKAFLEGLTK